MDTGQVLTQIARLRAAVQQASGNWPASYGVRAQVCEFFNQVTGDQSSFYKLVHGAVGQNFSTTIIAALDNFKAYVEAGLLGEVSPERRAQLDVVSDFLDQANSLLSTNGVHPAAPIVLIGATLEEFLRTWVEAKSLPLGARKPSLDAYAQVLLAEGLVTKQDMKDITAWGGLRNHAAHGEWTEVQDKQRASLMLEGVNLFLRKYGV
jgi:hypothetical protein